MNEYGEQGQEVMQQQPASSYEQQVAMLQEVSNNSAQVIKYRLDSNDIIAQYELYLRGLDWDESQGKYIRTRQPIMNERGVSFVITSIYAYVSKIITLGKIKEEEAMIRAREQEENVACVLFEKYDEFELNEAFYTTIVSQIGDIIYSSLTRSINGAENRNLTTSTNTVERFGQSEPKPNGIFGLFGGRK